MPEAREAVLERHAYTRERRGAHPGHRVRHLDHDAVRVLEPVDEVGLERPAPGTELLLEVAGDADGGVEAEVAAEGGMAHAAPGEEPWGVDRAGGGHDQPRVHAEPAVHDIAVAGEEHHLDAGGAAALDAHPPHPAAGT